MNNIERLAGQSQLQDGAFTCDQPSPFDPLAKLTTFNSGEESTRFNHVEGFSFGDAELQEELLDCMKITKANPTLQNKALCYDKFSWIIEKYWLDQKDMVEKLVREAIAA